MAYRTDIHDAERVGKDTSPSLPASLWLGLRGVHKLVIVNVFMPTARKRQLQQHVDLILVGQRMNENCCYSIP